MMNTLFYTFLDVSCRKLMDESGSSSNEDEVEEEPRLKYKRLGEVKLRVDILDCIILKCTHK